MIFHEKTIEYYIDRLKNGDHFAVAGFSDAEWFCILGQLGGRVGEKTALGQTICDQHGRVLLDVLRRRQHDPNFHIAIPKCLFNLPMFCNGIIQKTLNKLRISFEAYERDMVNDDLARDGLLFPFIQQLQQMSVVLIGPAHLYATYDFLHPIDHVVTATPNLHMIKLGIDNAVERVLHMPKHFRPPVFLVSAGVSAAVIIDRLYDELPQSAFIDCGSIWDAFAKEGGQRDWRAELYANEDKWNAWVKVNIHGPEAES